MAFNMKGSPAKMGRIQGTAGHASALKMKAEADAASALKKGTYESAKKKDPKLDEYIKTRSSSEKGSAEYDAAQNKINVAYDDKTRHGATSSTETKGNKTTVSKNVPGVSSHDYTEKSKRGGKKTVYKGTTSDDEKNTTYRQVTRKDDEGNVKSKKTKRKTDYDKDGKIDKKTKIKTKYNADGTVKKQKQVTRGGGRRTVIKTDAKGNVHTKSRRTLKGWLTGKGKGKRTNTSKYVNTDAGYKENEKPGGANYMDDFKKPMEKGYKSLTD
jgi:hypothetical protein